MPLLREPGGNLLLLFVALPAGMAPATVPEFMGAWSKAVKGLQGRLVVRPEDLNPGRRYAVTLELAPVALPATPRPRRPPVR